MKIAIFVKRTEDREIISLLGKVVFDRPAPLGSLPTSFNRLSLDNVKQELAREKWEFLEMIDACDENYFARHINLEMVGPLDNLATRIASAMYFKGTAHGHNEATMER